MMAPKASVQAYHAEYERLTGIRIQLVGRESWWCLWQERGLTVDDLRALIENKKRRIKAGELTVQSLAFRNLVANVDYAEEDIGILRAARAKAQAVRERQPAIRMAGPTGRPPEAADAARSAGDILAGAKAFEEFRKLKGEL